jgi:spermidine synthase
MMKSHLQEIDGKLCYVEQSGEGENHTFFMQELLFEGQTPFQSVLIAKSEAYGTMLFLDGTVQSSENDEFIYHESLVHPAMVAHSAPKRVLVIGAGEGATVREVLRHPTVEQVVMVDIDEALVELCKTHLGTWHQHAFADARLTLLFQDGLEFAKTCQEQFDVIILDLCDDSEDGQLAKLYHRDFYQDLARCLTPKGVLVTQANQLHPLRYHKHVEARTELAACFQSIYSYMSFIPSFFVPWGYIIATHNVALDVRTPDSIDTMLSQRMLDTQLKYYDGMTHQHMFSLSKALRQILCI